MCTLGWMAHTPPPPPDSTPPWSPSSSADEAAEDEQEWEGVDEFGDCFKPNLVSQMVSLAGVFCFGVDGASTAMSSSSSSPSVSPLPRGDTPNPWPPPSLNWAFSPASPPRSPPAVSDEVNISVPQCAPLYGPTSPGFTRITTTNFRIAGARVPGGSPVLMTWNAGSPRSVMYPSWTDSPLKSPSKVHVIRQQSYIATTAESVSSGRALFAAPPIAAVVTPP